MKRETSQYFSLQLIVIVVLATASVVSFQSATEQSTKGTPVYVGVAFQGNTTSEAKVLIDRVRNYTNLFVIGSSPVSHNESMISEVCDYAVASGLNIIVNFGYYDPYASSPDQAYRRWPWQHAWVQAAMPKYGEHFLGVYYDDEPGGFTLDYDWRGFFANYSTYFSSGDSTLHKIYAKMLDSDASGITPSDYDLEARYFAELLGITFSPTDIKPIITTFTSDYALYWYDYLGGYDVVFAQLGWNHTYPQDIALIKGAARLQGKQWGAIITWKYDEPPYLDRGPEIYKQMVAAYEAGATYVLIFNYPTLPGNDYGVMQEEHFLALQQFWNNVAAPGVTSTRKYVDADIALILPKNYGWGMRTIDDKIWGMWGPDDKSPQIWAISRQLVSRYGLRLDIVYNDADFAITSKYRHIFYWNDSV